MISEINFEDLFNEKNLKKIYLISQIQSKNLILSDIKKLKQNFEEIKIECSNNTLEELWYAYERVGYVPSLIISYIKNKGNLEPINFHLSEKSWLTWSSARQSSLRMMYSNPNAFFYRNRPPGEPPLHGPWTEEEEFFFHDRINFFKLINLSDQYWGLFSVPFCGRVGYQCSNFYRQFYKPEKFKNRPLPNINNLNLEDPYEYLKKEAINYIFNIMKNAPICEMMDPISTLDNNLPIIKKPIIKDIENIKEKIDNEEPMSKRTRNFNQKINNNNNNEINLNIEKKKIKKIKKKKIINLEENNNNIIIKNKNLNLALGAIDEITGKPMKDPMINKDGYVFDKLTWEKILNGKILCPNNISILNFDELIELNQNNFEKFKPYLINVNF